LLIDALPHGGAIPVSRDDPARSLARWAGASLRDNGHLRLAHPGMLLELLQMNEVADHLLRGEVIEEAQHALEQQPVLATAELLRHDDAGMRATSRLSLLVEWAEIADVEREERAVFRGCEGELLFIRGGVLTGFFGS